MLDILGGALSSVAVDVGDDLAHVLQVIIIIVILILLQQIDNDAAGLMACGLATVWRPSNLQSHPLREACVGRRRTEHASGAGPRALLTLMARDSHASGVYYRIAEYIHEMMIHHSVNTALGEQTAQATTGGPAVRTSAMLMPRLQKRWPLMD